MSAIKSVSKKSEPVQILVFSFWLLGLIAANDAMATAQRPDILIHEGHEYPLFSNPLESYYGRDNPRPRFTFPDTATWRGYVATWEIDRGVLYLKRIEAWLDGREVGLDYLFPGHPGMVEATWFTGQLRVPQGKMLQYIHMDYESIYERDLIITVQRGRIVKQEIVDNRKCRQ